jgi:TRAP-type C4-dicarboxylate transport system permease small subunit
MGFIYTLIGIPMILFAGPGFKIMGYVYLFMPILMAIIGFICVLIFGAAYNLLAKRLGGVEVEITTIE